MPLAAWAKLGGADAGGAPPLSGRLRVPRTGQGQSPSISRNISSRATRGIALLRQFLRQQGRKRLPKGAIGRRQFRRAAPPVIFDASRSHTKPDLPSASHASSYPQAGHAVSGSRADNPVAGRPAIAADRLLRAREAVMGLFRPPPQLHLANHNGGSSACCISRETDASTLALRATCRRRPVRASSKDLEAADLVQPTTRCCNREQSLLSRCRPGVGHGGPRCAFLDSIHRVSLAASAVLPERCLHCWPNWRGAGRDRPFGTVSGRAPPVAKGAQHISVGVSGASGPEQAALSHARRRAR